MSTRDELQSLLEMDCGKCHGKGKFSRAPEPNGYVHEWNCSECGGRGKLLTSPGEYLVGLIRHHIGHDLEQSRYGGGYTGFTGELFEAVRSAAWFNRGL